mmetsp:Transcript_11004/g.23600  ORF Transcript_11004/g.23600 Transcript_11004/m.23600 type:complete len:279 (-) Transcript_11004:100-936(-)
MIGAYSRVKQIGAGSYGKVILVKDKGGNYACIKQIDMGKLSSRERKDASNEVRVLAALQHPYVVSFRESFSQRDNLYIVMDYAEGGDLYKKVEKTRRAGAAFAEPQIARWMAQSFLALKYIHEKHVLHRDLKSQNLFLCGKDTLKVGDFGISKVLESGGGFAKTCVGTPFYLAPEICKERPYSWAADIWAMGIILHELCSLKVPFDAPNIEHLVKKITHGPIPRIPPRYSTHLESLGADLLDRDYRRRPSAETVLQRPYFQEEIRSMLRSKDRSKGAL